MSIQDTDNLIIGRGTNSYKITYQDLKDDLNYVPPVVGTINKPTVLAPENGAGGGTISRYALTNAITAVNSTGGSTTLTVSGNKDLDDLTGEVFMSNGTPADGPYTQTPYTLTTNTILNVQEKTTADDWIQTDPTTGNPVIWSIYGRNAHPSYPKENVFNGRTVGYGDATLGPDGGNGKYTWSFPAGIPFTKIEISLSKSGSPVNDAFKINGFVPNNWEAEAGDWTSFNRFEPTFDADIGDKLTSFEVGAWQGGPGIQAIWLDGKMLVDSTVPGTPTGETVLTFQDTATENPDLQYFEKDDKVQDRSQLPPIVNLPFDDVNGLTNIGTGDQPSTSTATIVPVVDAPDGITHAILSDDTNDINVSFTTSQKAQQAGWILDFYTKLSHNSKATLFENPADPPGFIVEDNTLNDRQGFHICDNGAVIGSGYSAFFSTVDLVKDTWYHIKYVRKPDGVLELYVDDVLRGSATSNVPQLGVKRIGLGSTANRRLGGYLARFKFSELTSDPDAFVVSTDVANNKMVVDSGKWKGSDGTGTPDGETVVTYKTKGGQGTVVSVDTTNNTITLNDTGDRDNRWIAENKADIDFYVAGPSIVDTPLETADVELKSSDFATTPAGADTLKNIVWKIKNDDLNTEVEESALLTNPYKPTLNTSTTYTVRVKHEGNELEDSPWSDSTTFTTGSSRNLYEYQRAQIESLTTRIGGLEANDITDDATDTALLTLIAGLAARIQALEESN